METKSHLYFCATRTLWVLEHNLLLAWPTYRTTLLSHPRKEEKIFDFLLQESTSLLEDLLQESISLLKEPISLLQESTSLLKGSISLVQDWIPVLEMALSLLQEPISLLND